MDGSTLYRSKDTDLHLGVSPFGSLNIALLLAVEAQLDAGMDPLSILLPYQRGDLLSLFYRRGQVQTVEHRPDGIHLTGRIPTRMIPYFAPYAHQENGQTP